MVKADVRSEKDCSLKKNNEDIYDSEKRDIYISKTETCLTSTYTGVMSSLRVTMKANGHRIFIWCTYDRINLYNLSQKESKYKS